MARSIPRAAAFDLYQRSSARLEEMLVRLSSYSPDTPVPGLDWTLGELMVHLVQVSEVAGQLLQGNQSPFTDFLRIGEINERLLSERPERDLVALSQTFSEAVERNRQRLATIPEDIEVPFHAGLTVAPVDAMVLMSGELLVHGWDLAQVSGERWEIAPADAALIMRMIVRLLPHLVDPELEPEFTATFEVRIRGDSSYRLHFENRELTVSVVAPGGPADCRISADPSVFLLMGYGRGSQIAPILTGKVVAWGRKPWFAARFTSLVKSP